jgi:hypothetical protein
MAIDSGTSNSTEDLTVLCAYFRWSLLNGCRMKAIRLILGHQEKA